MNDRINESKDPPPVDSRANLFYLLQKLSGLTEATGPESGMASAVSDEQIELYKRQNGNVL